MKRALLFVLPLLAAVALVSAVASAQSRTARGWEVGSKSTPVYVKGPLYIDSTQANVFDGGAALVATGIGHIDYDFPSLVRNLTAMNTICQDSPSITTTGVKFGDQLLLGIDQVPVNAFGVFTPRVTAADTTVVQECITGVNDGGTFNQPDSGFTVRYFR